MGRFMTEGKNDDAALWGRVAATVKPLKQTHLPPKPPKPRAESPPKPASSRGESSRGESSCGESGAQRRRESPPMVAEKPPPSTLHKPVDLRGSKIGGIARADARRLASGAIALTARLDLHGETLAGAYGALKRFIVEKQHQKHRYVLVITGKGVAGKGALRAALPRWLETPPLAQLVVAFHPAQGRHGGGGAWYVQLRRLGRLA